MRIIKVLFLIVLIIVASCKPNNYPDLEDGLYADIQTDKGNILVQLEYKNTPITVANFVSLAEGTNPYVAKRFKQKPFYDGLKFHRVEKDYVIQGGDPQGTGEGGPGYQFEDEFPTDKNGDLILTHNRKGILSMANGGFDTNGSQFFITLREAPNLDGVHTVFGNTIDGLQVIDSIEKGDVINKIEIIRVGNESKKFNAPKVFGNYFKKLEKEAEINDKMAKKARIEFLSLKEKYESEADSLDSGLKIYFIKKGEGQKPKTGGVVNVYYSGYFTSGELFTTNNKEIAEHFLKYDPRLEARGGYSPKEMDYSPDAELIPGFKEGLQKMNVGDKVMLFIPSHLAYGTQGRGPIPPDTDLIFELEIVDRP
ncbi:peptidylprolyl isomerase [Aureibaculum sp. 2210JD6-5]|uniref:peptidylprolyl isomerase n=1 Tax=Aureibaculum sp. 2210JD6-5 TaxID=3103957 RepID=UPI002AAC6BC2|nr:peptidylprolyl isomerase [Aureibaculum sp. 2210JD6-5]MDY7395177.1 peptidylprolyl isomerase [Aureibaculum sp. 2210JD6-5]